MDYLDSFNKAIKLTEELNLDYKSDFPVNSHFNLKNLNKIAFFFQTLMYDKFELKLTDIANKCIKYNNATHEQVKAFGIKSNITIGNVYNKKGSINKYFNYEDPSLIIDRTKNNINNKFGGHVWLTIDEKYILDVTIMPSIWFAHVKNNTLKQLTGNEQNDSYYKKVIFLPIEELNSFSYEYKPLLLGKNYLAKSGLLQ